MPDEALLAFAGAALAIEPAGGLTAPLDLEIAAGDLVLIDLANPLRCAAFADAAMGLVAPARGRVLFQGRDWGAEPPEGAQALRGRIGRVFRDESWIPYLTVAENVLLRPGYHTRISEDALLAEAARLCRTLGIPGLPGGFPSDATGSDLVRAGIARAFLGGPRLVLLEHSPAFLGAGLIAPLLRLGSDVRDDGGAVLWLVPDDLRELLAAVPATRAYRLPGDRLLPAGRALA